MKNLEHMPLHDTAKHLIAQLVSAVGHIHSRGIVHRDLRPENLLLNIDNDGIILKLIGFDTASLSDSQQFLPPLESSIFNTPPGEKSDLKKSDIWGIGCVFYYLLSGEEVDLANFELGKGFLTKEEREFLDACLAVDQQKRANIYDLEAQNLLKLEIRPSKRKIPKCITKAVIERIADLLDSPVKNIAKRCHEQRFDDVSAMYNMILSNKHALKLISDVFFKDSQPSRPKTAPVEKSVSTEILERPRTASTPLKQDSKELNAPIVRRLYEKNLELESNTAKRTRKNHNNDLGTEYSNKSAYQLSTNPRQSNNTEITPKGFKKNHTARAKSAPIRKFSEETTVAASEINITLDETKFVKVYPSDMIKAPIYAIPSKYSFHSEASASKIQEWRRKPTIPSSRFIKSEQIVSNQLLSTSSVKIKERPKTVNKSENIKQIDRPKTAPNKVPRQMQFQTRPQNVIKQRESRENIDRSPLVPTLVSFETSGKGLSTWNVSPKRFQPNVQRHKIVYSNWKRPKNTPMDNVPGTKNFVDFRSQNSRDQSLTSSITISSNRASKSNMRIVSGRKSVRIQI